MSILIKGLDMPKGDEMFCINIYPDGKVCIDMDLKCKRIATAVPVPPHGRLIDADALPRYTGYALSAGEVAMAIENAPTIIEAEEE